MHGCGTGGLIALDPYWGLAVGSARPKPAHATPNGEIAQPPRGLVEAVLIALGDCIPLPISFESFVEWPNPFC